MFLKKICLLILLLTFSASCFAQEFYCQAHVNAEQLTGVDTKVFKTLETSINDFVNTRKWGDDVFQTKEKIELVITIILNKKIDNIDGGYSGRISIQTKRPIYNTTYTSTLVNFTDNKFAIKYIQFQPLEFNDNRIVSNDALSSNLTAIIAYYCYVALGLDYDTFALKSGTDFFNKALNIVNNAPENNAIEGWKATEKGQRNRFWLVDQLHNTRFEKMREIYYNYHRLGLDLMSTDAETARTNINAIFPILQQLNQDNPSSMLLQFFFNAKSDELQNFVAASIATDKQKIIPILAQLDVANAAKYLSMLK